MPSKKIHMCMALNQSILCPERQLGKAPHFHEGEVKEMKAEPLCEINNVADVI